MRRRTREIPEEERRTPRRLRRFVAAEWSAESDLEAAGLWWAARDAWEVEHGELADVDDDSVMPDAPFDAWTM